MAIARRISRLRWRASLAAAAKAAAEAAAEAAEAADEAAAIAAISVAAIAAAAVSDREVSSSSSHAGVLAFMLLLPMDG